MLGFRVGPNEWGATGNPDRLLAPGRTEEGETQRMSNGEPSPDPWTPSLGSGGQRGDRAPAPLALAGALLLFFAAPAPVRAAAEPEGSAAAGGWTVTLDLAEAYRFRHATAPETGAAQAAYGVGADDESDQDLHLFLTSRVHDGREHFAADLALSLWADVDGRAPGGTPSDLGGVYDSGTSPSVWFDVYRLSAEYRTRGVLALARAGRQSAEHGPPATFDGATVRLRPTPRTLELFAFGGRTVHFFETDAAVFEDWIGSAGAVVRPLRQLRIELDYRFRQEDTTTRSGLTDNGYGAAVWYLATDWLRLKGAVRGIDDRVSHVGLDANASWDALAFGVSARIEGQPAPLREVNERDDPYFAVLGESLPHVRFLLDVWKTFDTRAGRYGLHLGWTGRFLLGDEPTRFNRDYGRLYLLAEGTDLFVRGPFASFVLEYHYTHEGSGFGDGGLFAVGGSVGYDVPVFRAELGTIYQRIRYDYFRDADEVEDVRTVFLDLGARPWPWLSVRARYDFEKRVDHDVHAVTVTLTQRY